LLHKSRVKPVEQRIDLCEQRTWLRVQHSAYEQRTRLSQMSEKPLLARMSLSLYSEPDIEETRQQRCHTMLNLTYAQVLS
jgi:hypothetical protein